ncbi:uncharacterized protein LOC116579495 [Mustela erminea]|uniref:uncharacterized protein LOC116579495 n=1 Tax=Mustela erminea TaxID=36723 RepID=UPI00138748F8|nr:uncharacterized protein LOC116579495 [Mustela erminea]
MKASQHGADLASERTQSPKPRTAGTLHMTQGCVFLDTKKVVTVENILPRTLKLSFSRLKIAVIHNTSVIDRHFLSPESSFCEKHHITSVHKQSFCENTDTGLELPRAQFPCHVQMARCVYTAEARVTEARPHLQADFKSKQSRLLTTWRNTDLKSKQDTGASEGLGGPKDHPNKQNEEAIHRHNPGFICTCLCQTAAVHMRVTIRETDLRYPTVI